MTTENNTEETRPPKLPHRIGPHHMYEDPGESTAIGGVITFFMTFGLSTALANGNHWWWALGTFVGGMTLTFFTFRAALKGR